MATKNEPKSKISLKARLIIIIFHLIDPFFIHSNFYFQLTFFVLLFV